MLPDFWPFLGISTHAPLAGRDECHHMVDVKGNAISTHAPLAGRDQSYRKYYHLYTISTHAPLAGRDVA